MNTATSWTQGDLGRRVQRRRTSLGLSREQLAERAGMDAGFVERIELRPVPLTVGALLRLADALDTSANELLGSQPEAPPGRGKAALRPVLEAMPAAECLRLLAGGGVGRVAFETGGEVHVLPVNYGVYDGRVVVRTAPSTELARHADGRVSFEIDRIDEDSREGWSVLVSGPARVLLEPELHRRAVRVDPWAGGSRPLYVEIEPERISGRRIRSW